ncbi:MAG TPA: DedA family protein [Ktedonobacterales bacterium]|nr:DedA family protein [Ktedonobacterales bacterium]
MDVPSWLNDAIVTYGYVAIAIAVALESMGVPFPGETALIAGSVYAGTRHEFNIIGVIVAAATGAIVGDNAGFAIGHYGGYPLLRRITQTPPLRPLHLDEGALAYAQRYFARHGGKTVFFGRFFSILRAYSAFLAGVNQMRWPPFLFWNAAGGILWAAIFGTLGFVLGRNAAVLGAVLRLLGTGGIIALGVFATLVVVVSVRRRRKPRTAVMRAAETTATRDESEPQTSEPRV